MRGETCWSAVLDIIMLRQHNIVRSKEIATGEPKTKYKLNDLNRRESTFDTNSDWYGSRGQSEVRVLIGEAAVNDIS